MSQFPDAQSISEGKYHDIFEATSDGLVIYDIDLDSVVEANPAACAMYGYTHHEFVGLSPADFMVPESYTLFEKQLKTAEPAHLFESPAIHIRKDGSQFHVEIHRSFLKYRGQACLLSVVRDISQRIQTEKLLSEEIAARLREQATLLAISHTLASTLEFRPSLILKQLREIVEYTHGGLFILEDSKLTTLAMLGTPFLEQSPPIDIQVKTSESLVILFNEHRPIRIADVWSDDAQAQFLRTLLEDGAAILLEGMQSWMWVPLAVKSRIIGGMGVAHEQRNYFTSHHADLALSVANQAAITMINAELYRNAQALAVLEERQRLAQNLHDAVNQSLFSAGLIADVLPRLWDRDQDQARRSLNDLRRLTRAAQAEMRALLAELRPSALMDTDLGELLHLLGNALSGRINLPVTVTAAKEAILPAEVQVAFYRVCHEAVNNIAKHAKASRVDIDLKDDGIIVELRIHDDGKGFDPERILAGHYGLGIMRERAEAAGALLTITSQPGQGTDIIMQWTKTSRKEAL